MPNYCCYEMRVRGKPENIDELIDVMTDYDHPRHFWRVFSAEPFYFPEEEDGTVVAGISGDCAWSVYTCMFDGELTYAELADPQVRTSLQKESARLGLEIEVYSDEPGVGFQEHYYFANGKELVNDSVDCMHAYFDDDDAETEEEREVLFEKFKREYELDSDLTLEDLNEDNEIVIGGYGEWEFEF